MKRLGLRHSATILASLMMSGLMPMPPKRDPQPLTPEQIKAAEKRARKAKRLAKELSDGT